ncbi:pentatricopeptide repeat-containing protein, mitochondrial [Trifolium repens]|nr:pentatricopeptide repeat-containing protein, mitochondrial [Trifolium repens]
MQHVTKIRGNTEIFNSSNWSRSIRNNITDQTSFRTALVMYKQSRHEGTHNPTVIPQLLKACDSLAFLHCVKGLHAESIKAGSNIDVFIGTAIVAAYAKCGVVLDARKLFDYMPERNVVTWNAMVGGYLRNGDTDSALIAFEEMPAKTRVSWSQMIGGLAKNGDTVSARRLFDKVPCELKDVVIWTVMVDGYAKKGEMEAAREVFELMPERNCFVWSSMVCGYCKKGSVLEAEAIFRCIPVRNLEIWNSMIAGYVQNGFGEKALQTFEEMRVEGFEPDEFTVVSVLSACAQLGDLHIGKQIHNMIEFKGMVVNQFVLSGLVDMYSKCGDLVNARLVFERCNERNVFCWNAMISGFAINGKCKEVLEYLGRMEESNIRPDAVTFTTILSACAHAGLVSEALEVLSKMEAYGIEIGIRHYGCMVDLLGRAGRLKEAFELIKRMPVKPNETVLGSMIGACWIHSDMKMAEQVIKMISADSATCDNSHNVLLSNIYAASEKWEIAEMIRRSMVDGGSEKIPGCSSIILRNSDVDLSISKEVSHQMNGLRQSKE